MTTTRLVASVVVVHTEEGRLILQIKQIVNTPMLTVVDSAGNEFIVQADDYEKASPDERARFYCAKATAIRAEAAKWN